ncbi:leucine-rich repeat protein [Faecalibacterium duncaniae]|uniref:leucine-rich repeat protein n=1 Tax=Faecalibacterium duncaniae (strain DSM 17677 / JCM 31915 / A2-165) TaxID=411483 RepID=UPI003ED8AE0D
MRPKRLISLLVAVCMMITMLPLSAVTAFAEDTSSSTGGTASDGTDTYKYEYTVNDGNATITKFLGPVGSANPNFYDIKIPSELGGHPVTGLGEYSFAANPYDGHQGNPLCSKIRSVTIQQNVTSIGKRAFDGCSALTTLSLGEDIQTIGNYAFENCTSLTGVTIPQSVTSIGYYAFEGCTHLNPLTIKGPITSMGNYAFAGSTYLTSLTLCDDIQTIGNFAFVGSTSLKTVTLPKNLTSIGEYAFADCSELESITIPEKVETIEPDTFNGCSNLESIMLPAGLTSFQDKLTDCPAGNTDGAIYYKNYKAKADALLADNDNNPKIDANGKLRKRNFLYLCKVTFDANGGDLTGKGGNLTNYLTDNLTDHAEVPVYKTEKITETKANDLKETDLDAINAPKRTGYKFTGWYTEDGKDSKLFNVKDTAIMEDITLHAGWEFDPDALDCHQLTVTGGTVTVKYDGSDVTNTLTVTPGATTGPKTYSVPEGAEVTVTLDKNTVSEGKVFDGWSTTGNLSLLTGQDYKAETITFTMSSGVNVSAKYRDAATDHTHDTAVCHPLTVTGGIVTVKKGDKDVTDTLTVTTDETTGKKTYSVPDGATVTVTLDKTLIPEGMVFDIWSTGKFSLPLGQDYKAESITFTMNTMNTMSSDVDIAAQYRDATIEDDGPNVLGTAAIIGTAAVGTAVLGYQAYSLGAEFAGKLMALPYFPSNRSALAMMLWEDAGKPMPESELLYPDVGQEEQDMDLQHAARWAMENELIPDLNDKGTAPEEMKFFPANPVSKLDVLNAWQKAQELKNN